ncbi:hypothetical protein PFAG_01740 [Plasmodium falciparum Santa Lucia]|uniref:Uncharacterized protein n=6 Tax=Plasmodium falciparum TaxID=5833 RepID=W4J6A8_PLAFP|nr:hypothetical protein PFTANZ_01875 [Plasmodium falciparum Tanzania (2000708)]ETW45914.1 hypothetical protein PFMALIP_06022 [Plasmodium falciparum MaliPS096_E11]ETW57132.1 hypothetical protein PFUGPA_00909 [Plasmodium falciparum Palo Alto/Uganda]ETW60088.1 hypothetical protein PFMC_04076 [Plasmodium falciparum CAMP/Malaysia]EUR73757.1 hypothetical protein PFBG_01818 [Plasmodium falciparum 7G8]EUT88280.1 hypothetical protein PFAG_01740 [Plasmodium falciparum Santa Lucia]
MIHKIKRSCNNIKKVQTKKKIKKYIEHIEHIEHIFTNTCIEVVFSHSFHFNYFIIHLKKN